MGLNKRLKPQDFILLSCCVLVQRSFKASRLSTKSKVKMNSCNILSWCMGGGRADKGSDQQLQSGWIFPAAFGHRNISHPVRSVILRKGVDFENAAGSMMMMVTMMAVSMFFSSSVRSAFDIRCNFNNSYIYHRLKL